MATVLEGGCPPNYAPSTTFQGQPRFGGRCADAAYRTTEVLRELKPDLIVASAYAEEGFESDEIAIAGYHQVLEDWLEIAPVTVIRDYPSTVGKNMPQCVALNANNHLACANERGSALPEDLLYTAATILDNPQIQLIDLTDLYCDETTCYPVVGSLPVYYDSDHIARSFALTLVPVLTEKLTLPSL